MEIRTLSFPVLPSACIIVDSMAKAQGITESEAARFIYMAGLYALAEGDWTIREMPELRMKMVSYAIDKQSQHMPGLSRYALDDADAVEKVYPKPLVTDQEILLAAGHFTLPEGMGT